MTPGADDRQQRPSDAPADAEVPNAEVPRTDRLDSESVRLLYEQHGDELRRFLLGVVRDPQIAADAMQAALVKAIEQGHTARDETRKAWLFRVAYHEALLVRRRQAAGDRVLREVVWKLPAVTGESAGESADTAATRREQTAAVRQAIATLSEEQQAVVRLRIHDNLTFAKIAKQLDIPLGTALTRMRTALAKLKTALDHHK
ncbi:MAG: RNA polymerase sigma factor [Pirellulales bacterium]